MTSKPGGVVTPGYVLEPSAYGQSGVRRQGGVDAQHIAIATISRVEVLVSWNFRHIVNLQRIRGYNAVNLRDGYPLLEIRTPQEVIRCEEE